MVRKAYLPLGGLKYYQLALYMTVDREWKFLRTGFSDLLEGGALVIARG